MSQYAAMLDAHLKVEFPRSVVRGERADTPEQRERLVRVHARALEVFGSRLGASVWCHSPNERACGRWTSPSVLAHEGEDGCRRVLVELDRIEADVHRRTGWVHLMQ